MEAWKSRKTYRHPQSERPSEFWHLCLSTTGYYYLQSGPVVVTCPQEWAAETHQREANAEHTYEEKLEGRAPRKEQRGDRSDPRQRRD